MLQALRGAVRPAVTLIVVLAQLAFVGAGVHSGNFDGAEMMIPITTVIIGFWFAERAVNNRGRIG